MRDPGQVYSGIGMFSRLLGKWEKEYIIYTFMAVLRVTAGSNITLRKLLYFSMWSFSLESNWKAWRLGHRREKNGQLRLYNMNNLCKVRGTCEQTAHRGNGLWQQPRELHRQLVLEELIHGSLCCCPGTQMGSSSFHQKKEKDPLGPHVCLNTVKKARLS